MHRKKKKKKQNRIKLSEPKFHVLLTFFKKQLRVIPNLSLFISKKYYAYLRDALQTHKHSWTCVS